MWATTEPACTELHGSRLPADVSTTGIMMSGSKLEPRFLVQGTVFMADN